MHLKRLIFIVLILISSCNGNKKTDKIVSGQKTLSEFKLPKSDFVILPLNKDLHWVFKDGNPTILTQAELIEIENILKIATNKNNETQKTELIEQNKKYPEYQRKQTGYELKLEGYKRQYIPIINNKGEKEVWINFFCDNFGADYWKTEIVQVEDGGNCYYNIKINLKTKEYYDLAINGNT